MAKNDLVLLNALLEKKLLEHPNMKTVGKFFDVFVFENLLKDNDLSYEEIKQGWVDGGDDGGIDQSVQSLRRTIWKEDIHRSE